MAAGAVFTPVEEVQRCLVAPWEMVEKVAKVFFKEEWVEEPNLTILRVVLVVVVVQLVGGGGAGGGGGYSGGSSGDNTYDSCGGGGGSYNVGKDQQSECCYNAAGHGRVIVTYTAVARSDR